MGEEIRRALLKLLGGVDAAEAAEASALEAHMTALGLSGDERGVIVDAARMLASSGVDREQLADALALCLRFGSRFPVAMTPVFVVSPVGVVEVVRVLRC